MPWIFNTTTVKTDRFSCYDFTEINARAQPGYPSRTGYVVCTLSPWPYLPGDWTPCIPASLLCALQADLCVSACGHLLRCLRRLRRFVGGEGTQAGDADGEEKENIGREVGADRGEPGWQIMFEDIRQFEALHPHFMQLQAAGSCTVIDGSMHPENRTVTNGGGPTAGYRYYEKCPFAIKTCPANYYPITPSMECGVMGAIVPKLEGPESTPKLLADNPSHPLNNGVPMFQPFTVTAP